MRLSLSSTRRPWSRSSAARPRSKRHARVLSFFICYLFAAAIFSHFKSLPVSTPSLFAHHTRRRSKAQQPAYYARPHLHRQRAGAAPPAAVAASVAGCSVLADLERIGAGARVAPAAAAHRPGHDHVHEWHHGRPKGTSSSSPIRMSDLCHPLPRKNRSDVAAFCYGGGCRSELTASIRYSEGREVYLSYLPLAHVLERVACGTAGRRLCDWILVGGTFVLCRVYMFCVV